MKVVAPEGFMSIFVAERDMADQQHTFVFITFISTTICPAGGLLLPN